MLKVLLVDDHALFAGGLQTLLEAYGITVAGRVRDGAAAIAAARRLHPDVILMDLQMPGCDGLTATRRIKNEFPNTKIVILTMINDSRLLWKALKAGASGFLLKNLEAEELLDLLAKLANDEIILSPELANRLLAEFNCPAESLPGSSESGRSPKQPLTPRQQEVLNQVARGLTYREIASALQISESTVKYHMNAILERLHLENRSQAIAYAAENHLTE